MCLSVVFVCPSRDLASDLIKMHSVSAPKDGEPCVTSAKSGETLVEACSVNAWLSLVCALRRISGQFSGRCNNDRPCAED